MCVCVGGRWKGKTEVLTPRKFKTLGFISSTLAPPGCRDLNMHPFLHLIHLANRCPETHQPKPQIPSAYGCGPWDIGEGREEWAEAGGKQGWGDRGDERGGGDPEKTESGSLVLSGLCTKSRFGTLWVRPPPRSDSGKRRDKEPNILSSAHPVVGTGQLLPTATLPWYCGSSTREHPRV